MTDKPQVSIVIPLCSSEEDLTKTLNSVLSQTLQNIEILLIDCGADAENLPIIQTCPDPRIRIIRQGNRDITAARNRGTVEARANRIFFLNAGETWSPQFLETSMQPKKSEGNQIWQWMTGNE